jgi:hypothetical protein
MTTEQAKACQREKRTGRPPNNKNDANYWDTDLHRFLYPHFENVPGMTKEGRIDTGVFARKAGVARWTVYRWFKHGISTRSINAIIKITKVKGKKHGTLTADDLRPFIKIG